PANSGPPSGHPQIAQSGGTAWRNRAMEARGGTERWNHVAEPNDGTTWRNRTMEPRGGTARWNRVAEPRDRTAWWNRVVEPRRASGGGLEGSAVAPPVRTDGAGHRR